MNAAEPILVKRYAETRFYDATHGRYVSVAELGDWVAKGVALSLIDARTGQEIELGRL
jgi:polyhydroxyalkanoate synthesis regulator protein